MGDAHQFVLEVMIAYGIRFREYLELRLDETQRAAEARLEQKRTRALRVELNDERKDDLLPLIAHELRTPLTAALGNLGVATRAFTRGQLDTLPPLLQSARDALGRLSRLMADLVEVGRNEPHELAREAVLLDERVEQSRAWVPRPPAKSASARTTFGRPTPSTCSATRTPS